MICIPLDVFERIGNDDKAILAFVKLVRVAEPTEGIITSSLRQLSRNLNIPYGEFRYAVSRLCQKGVLTQTSAQGFTQNLTQVTICDFASYNIASRKASRSNTRNDTRKQSTANNSQIVMPTAETKSVASNECVFEEVPSKTIQKYKSFDLSYVDSQLYEKFYEFLKMRDAIKKPLKTDNGIRKSYNELLKRANEDAPVHRCSVIEAATNIMQRSIDKEWQGFFNVPLNYNGNRQPNNSVAATQQRINEFLQYRSEYNQRQGAGGEDEPLF